MAPRARGCHRISKRPLVAGALAFLVPKNAEAVPSGFVALPRNHRNREESVMSRDEWNALIEQARGCDMLELAQAHGANLKKSGGEYVGPCLVCGTGHDRFSINIKKQVFHCRVCGKGGHGPVDLEMFLAGCEFVEAVKQLTNTTSLSGKRPATKTAANPQAEDQRKRECEAEEAKQHAKAAWLWSLRQPVAGSPVERYLRARGYIGAIPPTIGYLPAHDEHPHAMISAFPLPNEIEPRELGAPLTVRTLHLTKLLPDGSDRIRTKQGKITVGSPSGLPIVVSCIHDGLSLAITEGIEDALAYASIGIGAWAAGSAPLIPSLAKSIANYVTSITIEQHIDADQQGQRAVTRLQELLRARPVRAGEHPIEIRIREASDT